MGEGDGVAVAGNCAGIVGRGMKTGITSRIGVGAGVSRSLEPDPEVQFAPISRDTAMTAMAVLRTVWLFRNLFIFDSLCDSRHKSVGFGTHMTVCSNILIRTSSL